VYEYTLAHLTLILSLHYLVKCRSRSLAIYKNKFILGSACVGSITESTESLKTCYVFKLVGFISKSHVDKLEWCINSEWTALSRELLNVLLVSRVTVHRLHLCWRKHF